MELYKKIIIDDIKNLIFNINKNKIDSLYPYLISDLENLYDICYNIGISQVPNYNIDNDRMQKFIIDEYTPIECINFFSNINFLKTLSININEFYENHPNYKKCLDNIPQKKIDESKCVDICIDFLEKYNKEYLNILHNVYKCGKLLKSSYDEQDSLNGLSYTSYLSFSPYISFLDTNTIITSITFAHEASHIFSHNLTKNYPPYEQLKKELSPTLEIRPYTTELFFQDYLKKNKLVSCDFNGIYGDYYGDLHDFSINILNLFLENQDNVIKVFRNNYFKKYMINIIGKAVALYLYSLNDKEKCDYLLDKIDIESCQKEFIDILNDNSMDVEDIMNFDSAKKLILKKWKY